MKKNLLKRDGVQSLIASLLCVVLGLLIGYIVLLIINPAGAGKAISTVIKNFLTYKKPETQMKYFGNTLVRTAPLLMCSLSILFAYKAGLFNIGAAGQYCAGAAHGALRGAGVAHAVVAVHDYGHAGRRAARRHQRSAQVLLQRQRGHLRHYAQLDHASTS